MSPLICKGQLFFSFENQGIEKWTQSRPSAWDTSSIKALGGRFSMKHIFDNPESGHDQASICFDSLCLESGDTEWKFRIRHGSDPSSSNNWAVYLVSDMDASGMFPGGEASGYAIGVNYQDSDDLLKLWKLHRGAATSVITTGMNWQEQIGSNGVAGVKILRSPGGNLKILIDRQGSFNNFAEEGSGKDEEIKDMKYFGIYYEYSSRQDQKLWIDDITINGIFNRDTIPPVIMDVTVSDRRTLIISFSEMLDTISSKNRMNFFTNQGVGYPAKVIVDTKDRLILVFDKDFPDGITCSLRVEGTQDEIGNYTTSSVYEFVFYLPKKDDIIINEIMADPSPAIGLPEHEYIELLNRSDYDIDLQDWTLQYGKTIKTFHDFTFHSNSFVLLVDEEAVDDYTSFGNCLPIFTSRTSLPNIEGMIEIKDKHGKLISWLNYSDEWFGNDYYSSGGWSLERIDPERFCGNSNNWITSTDPLGGTPGRINSVLASNPDTVRPEISFVAISEESLLEIFFTEAMDSVSLCSPENYDIDQGIDHPIEILLSGPEYQSVCLRLNKPVYPGMIYNITLADKLMDCMGNKLNISGPVCFAKPELPVKNDILISEIMFNPLPGNSEFLEIYNYSRKVFDLSYLVIAKRDEQTAELNSIAILYKGHRLFYPGEFILLAADLVNLVSGYSNAGGTMIEVPGMPAFDERKGTVVLLDKWLQVIDELTYHENMHFPLLSSTEGVSLERLDYNRPSSDPGNWHSAAESAGFSTPGYENSQYDNGFNTGMEMGIENEIFTPDNDGYLDFTSLCYTFSGPGNVINVWVFDPMGRMVRRLAMNQLLGSTGCINWDGTDNQGRRARMGIYLIYGQIFDTEGRVRQVKKTCILATGRK